jgi:hypothetical protein
MDYPRCKAAAGKKLKDRHDIDATAITERIWIREKLQTEPRWCTATRDQQARPGRVRDSQATFGRAPCGGRRVGDSVARFRPHGLVSQSYAGKSRL